MDQKKGKVKGGTLEKRNVSFQKISSYQPTGPTGSTNSRTAPLHVRDETNENGNALTQLV